MAIIRLSHSELKRRLDEAYFTFHQSHFIEKDAICFVRNYADPKDQEIVAFLSALIAYGNVAAIIKSVKWLLLLLGETPHRSVLEKKINPELKKFYHRFTKGEDILIVLHWLSEALNREHSLENFFLRSTTNLPTQKDKITAFVNAFCSLPLSNNLKKYLKPRERNLKYLLPTPERGSACKRLNMFLRWVVRKDDGIDLGLWKNCSPKDLMLPVDTHLLKIIQQLKWSKSKTANWRLVEESTEQLRKFDSLDPIRYDFSLCHLSMEGNRIT